MIERIENYRFDNHMFPNLQKVQEYIENETGQNEKNKVKDTSPCPSTAEDNTASLASPQSHTYWRKSKVDKFTVAFLQCALWSSNDDNDTPLDENYTIEDFDPKTLEKLQNDCQQFQNDYQQLFQNKQEHAGHDFWLTRNGHGAGFWDGDWPKNVGDKLTQACKNYPEISLYVLENKIYLH